MQYVSNTNHYKEVLSRVQTVKHSLWIGTADIKDLYVERARRRNLFLLYWPIFISKGVEVRLIHANEPGPLSVRTFTTVDIPYYASHAMFQFITTT